MKRSKNSGFTMIELLVVLLIVAILAAIAAPIFLQNADKTRASEAVTAAGSIRSAERNYQAQNAGQYLPVTDGATYFGTGTGSQSTVLGVQIRGEKYFSPEAYTVTTTGAAWPSGSPISTAPTDFVILVDGSQSVNSGFNPAPNAGEVNSIQVAMDNSGQIIWSTDTGASWSKY